MRGIGKCGKIGGTSFRGNIMKRDKLLKHLIIINGIILFCPCVYWSISATGAFLDFWDIILSFIPFLFLMLLSGIVQGIVYLIFKWFKTPMIIWTILFLSPSLYFTSNEVYYSLPRVKAAGIIRDGRLAQIPGSSKNLKAYGWSGLFSGEGFLRFEASPEEIQEFIDNSPSLKGVAPKIYSEEKMYIPYPSNYDGDSTHDYFTPKAMAPEWFKEELRNKGRVYEIPSEEGHNWGKVIIDDLTNTVYIWVIWS